ncbi:MAG: succinyl-diaminopimelate desuccinylase [Nautiliaceae bacterium]
MRKVYELKKGAQLLVDDEIIEFEEIRGDKAVFYNSWGIEIVYPDYLDIDEIGVLVEEVKEETIKTPSLF